MSSDQGQALEYRPLTARYRLPDGQIIFSVSLVAGDGVVDMHLIVDGDYHGKIASCSPDFYRAMADEAEKPSGDSFVLGWWTK